MDGWVFVMLVLCRILRFGPLDFFPLKILMRHVHCTIQISLTHVVRYLDGTMNTFHQVGQVWLAVSFTRIPEAQIRIGTEGGAVYVGQQQK